MRSCNINGIRVGGSPPVLMGVVNISPESFFSDSYVPDGNIRKSVERMITNGADLIDIGARSTAPGSIPISVEDERVRLIRALKELDGLDVTISIDTMHPEVLQAALKYDVHLANDISGLVNVEMGRVIAESGIPAVLMATNQTPGDCRSYNQTEFALQRVINRAEEAGVKSFILDPAVGKWIPERTPEADFELCRRFGELQKFDSPLLAAVSRKSFIGSAIGREPKDRLAATLGVTTFLILAGAAMIRTHDVAETRDLITVISSIQET